MKRKKSTPRESISGRSNGWRIFDAEPVPRLTVGQSPRVSSLSFGANVVNAGESAAMNLTLALHPGSGSERKNWPEERWAELLQHLVNSTNLNLLLVGGEAEGERLQRLTAALPPMRMRVARNLPLPELAGALQQCAAFIGHDSGISHLAAALGIPGLVLWSHTMEEVLPPPNEKVAVLKAGRGIKDIPVAQVTAELGRVLKDRTPRQS